MTDMFVELILVFAGSFIALLAYFLVYIAISELRRRQ